MEAAVGTWRESRWAEVVETNLPKWIIKQSWPAGTFTYGRQPEILAYIWGGYLLLQFAHSVWSCRHNAMLVNTCKSVWERMWCNCLPSDPREKSLEISRCVLFLAVCVYERWSESHQSWGGRSVALCLCLQLSYLYFISPGCLFVLRRAAPPLAVSALPSQLLSPTPLPPQADSHPLLLPLLFMVSLSLSWRLIPRSPQLPREPDSACQEGWFCLGSVQPLILSVCLFCGSVALGRGGCFFTCHCIPFSSCVLFFFNTSSVTAAKNGCTSDSLQLPLIAAFALFSCFYSSDAKTLQL